MENLAQHILELEKRNKEMAAEIERLKERKQWEPAMRSTHSYCILPSPFFNGGTADRIESGFAYVTREAGAKAWNKIRAYARQLRWLYENDDGWAADWGKRQQNKYSVGYDYAINRYISTFTCSYKRLDVIYMSSNNAEKLAAGLNDGSIVF